MKPRRKLIAISLIVYIVVLAVSALYFIPKLFAFARSPQSGVAPAEPIVVPQVSCRQPAGLL